MFLMTLLLHSSGHAKQKVMAADLVKDGQVIDLKQEKYRLLFAELKKKTEFSQDELNQLFAGVKIDRKVLQLMDRQWESRPYYKYWPIFITPTVIEKGKNKLKKHKSILDRIEKELHVDREIVVAIWGIESKFGVHKGKYNVFRTLNTLFNSYPRRSKFFRKQLIHFLVLCKENQFNPLLIKGSYAGAFGQTQFIPSSYREYALSYDGDTYPDVFHSTDDILASIANYLRRYHWNLNETIYYDIGNELKSAKLISAKIKGRKGRIEWEAIARTQNISLPKPRKNKKLSIVALEVPPEQGGGFRFVAGYPNFHAITAWNHSNRYAMAVTELAEKLKE